MCQWYPVPKCLNNSNGTDTKESCEKNCVTESFAKCDTSTGKCVKCDKATDPDCKNTIDYCSATCKPQGQVTGVFRGVQINQGFHVGEWDFDFSVQGSVKITFTGDEEQVYAATPTMGGGAAGQASPITLKFTAVPSGNFLGVKSGDELKGIYQTADGQSQVFTAMHLGTAKTAGAAAPADFDAAMTSGYEFDLFSCKKEGENGCDFSAAMKHAVSQRNVVTIN